MSTYDDASLILYPSGYKASKLYSLKPTDGSGDLDVVRATTATRVNSAGLIETVANNVPRLDYTNGSCPSILVEPQRTNLILRSEEFDNAYWTKNELNTTGTPPWVNVAVAPDGTTTAEKLIPNTVGSSSHTLRRNVSLTSGTTYTHSVYAKKGEFNFISLGRITGTGTIPSGRVTFNLDAGTKADAVAGFESSIQDVGNGWYRCSVTFTATATGATDGIGVYVLNNNQNVTFVGDETSGVFIWGAQLEVGSNPSSYIPTVAAAVTRNADVVSKTGISSLIGQTEGTLFAEVDIRNPISAGTAGILEINDGASSNQNLIRFFQQPSNFLRVVCFSGASLTVAQNAFTLPLGVSKIAVAYQAGSISVYLNGGQQTYSTFVLPLNMNNIVLGRGNIIRAAALLPTALTEQQAIQLTTL